MKKVYLLLLTLFLVLGTNETKAQSKKYSVYGVGFYNLENLFDTCHDAGKNDYEYLPDGTNKWTGLKYTHKLRNMSRVLSDAPRQFARRSFRGSHRAHSNAAA